MRKVTVWMTLLLTAVALCGCKKKPAGKKQAPSSQSAFVPSAEAAARGWLPRNRKGSRFAVDRVRVYDKSTVFELLNGGAEVLLDAGLVTLLHARLEDRTGKFTAYEVQVMQLSTPAQARALLAKEKPPKARAVKLGDKAWAVRGTVLFVKGAFLVSVGVQPAGKLEWAPTAEIARLVARTPNARW